VEVRRIIEEIDSQIARLQRARILLADTDAPSTGSAKARKTKTAKSASKAKKRVLSPEARKRIADAQKRRWAKSRTSKKK